MAPPLFVSALHCVLEWLTARAVNAAGAGA